MGIKMMLRTSKTRLSVLFSGSFKEMIESYNEKVEGLEQNILPLKEKIDSTYEHLEGQLKNMIYAPPGSASVSATSVSAPSCPPYDSFYPNLPVTYTEVNENAERQKKIKKEGPPYTGQICRACGFVSVSNKGNYKFKTIFFSNTNN